MMQVKEITKKEIQKFSLYHESEIHFILKNGKRIWKLYRPEIQFLLPGLVQLEVKKVKSADDIQAEEIVKPDSILVDRNSKKYLGYEMSYSHGHSLNELFFQYDWNNQLDKITELFLAISKGIQNIHKEDIVAPDLFSKGNILYNVQRKKVKFIDYDGLQIKHMEAPAFCSDFHYIESFVIQNPHLHQSDLFTKRFDKLSFMIEYLFWCTSVNFAENLAANQFQPQIIPNLLRAIGLNDMEELNQYLLYLLFSKENVPYPDEIINKINREYCLAEHPLQASASVFVKKR